MTILYKPVLIETAEQAEALPVGTVAVSESLGESAVLVQFQGGVFLLRGGLQIKCENLVGWTALVPVEAEEETSVVVSAPGSRDIDAHPYSEANMDSDGNVWFDEGLNRVDVTEQFNAWAKQHTRTRFITPWEEVSDRP